MDAAFAASETLIDVHTDQTLLPTCKAEVALASPLHTILLIFNSLPPPFSSLHILPYILPRSSPHPVLPVILPQHLKRHPRPLLLSRPRSAINGQIDNRCPPHMDLVAPVWQVVHDRCLSPLDPE